MDTQTLKSELRRQIRQQRVDLAHRKRRSDRIQQTAGDLPAIQSAQTIMVYVGYRSEVRTDALTSRLIEEGKTVYVPWCDDDELRPFRLESLGELQPGTFGILEPPAELKQRPERRGLASDLEIVLVPGIAFDRSGHRLGQGKGYYDRLLSDVSDDCVIVGLAFDAQLVERVPVEPHDVTLDLIVTESEVIEMRK
jgi:5-formyltetrahydrofolate cyclo-ligase